MKSQNLDSIFTTPIFLPNFLLGDDPPTTLVIPEIFHERITTPGSFKSTANVIKRRTFRQKLFSRSLTEISIPSSPFVCEKAGPPKTGLFDTINKMPVAYYGEPATFNGFISIILPGETNLKKYLSFNRNEEINSYWVTVFGFPSSALNIVLSLLSTCGTIIEQKYTQGNWVHIRFSSFNEVSKALLLNGKLIFQNVMIGVQLHHPRGHMKKSIMASGINTKTWRHFSITPQDRYNSVIPGPNVPKKSTDIFSKTIDYVFGW